MPDANTFLTTIPLVAAAIAAAIAVWLLLRAATRAIERFAARHEQEALFEEATAFAKRLTKFVRSTLWFIAFLAASLVMLRGLGVRGSPRLSVEEMVAWLLGPGLRLIVIATSAYLIARGTHFLIDSLQIFLVSRDGSEMGLLERKKRIQTLGQLLRVVATLLVLGVATLMALSLFNVDIRPILTGAGIAGLAVGFGAQNLVRDVIAGFFLILEDQVRLGDVVSINGKSGLVEAIRLRTIALRSQDGTVHVIPNGVINELSNMTKDYSYAVLDINIPYEEDLQTVDQEMSAASDQIRARRNDDEAKARAEQPGDHLLDGQPRCASDAKASQHDETSCEECDEPERRADELREPLGEGCRLLEQRFLFVTGGEALDGAGGCS